jgi:cbb3-type cytochrome oxidase subunit 3
MAYLLLYGLLALSLCFAAVIIMRYLKNRRARLDRMDEAAPLAAIDLESDEVTAADRPSDEWLALARELLKKGDYRLAIRALYLSNLAMLADANLLTIARAKSDHDYMAELRRQGRAEQRLLDAFSDNITIFQQVWYGMRDIHEKMLKRFLDNHKRIMTDVGAH